MNRTKGKRDQKNESQERTRGGRGGWNKIFRVKMFLIFYLYLFCISQFKFDSIGFSFLKQKPNWTEWFFWFLNWFLRLFLPVRFFWLNFFCFFGLIGESVVLITPLVWTHSCSTKKVVTYQPCMVQQNNFNSPLTRCNY